jgi:hypothetical protein
MLQFPGHKQFRFLNNYLMVQKYCCKNQWVKIIAEAKQILELVRNKKMLVAINFQLRYAPYIWLQKNLFAMAASVSRTI